MTPPHPFHAWGSRLLGSTASGWWGSLSAFAIGALTAGFILSIIRQGDHRIGRTLRGGGTAEGKTLEELIAEKERLEDLIAEVAAREGKR